MAIPQEHRVALVIGNSSYRTSPLRNPVNDARAMRDRLSQLGFDVIYKEDVRTREIGSLLREFRNKLRPGCIALFYHAGHGLQVRGENFLPTVDAEIAGEEDVALQSLGVGAVLSLMDESKAGVNLVLLDACRNNPYARGFRSPAVGLARIEPPSGTLIHYATRPGSVAEDGAGAHGTYTEALLAQMSESGVPVEQTLKQVTVRVKNATRGKQIPWMEGSLTGEFYFVLKGPTQITVQRAPLDSDAAAWQAAEDSGTPSAYQAYLNEYPKGLYAAAARVKLATLPTRQSSGAPTAPAERLDPDTALWSKVRGSGERAYYEGYLKEFPRGKYAALARTELNVLMSREKEQITLADRQDWDTAKQTNTEESYDAYLAIHPKGRFAEQALRARSRARSEAGSKIALGKSAGDDPHGSVSEKQAAAPTEPGAPTKHDELREEAVRELSMAQLSAASFTMGAGIDDISNDVQVDEEARPQHAVTISAFELVYYEVTVGQFRRFVEATGYITDAERSGNTSGCHTPSGDGGLTLQTDANWRAPGFPQDDSHPVVCVSWNDAQSYVAWLNGSTFAFRLPSESEWEYAARAGTDTARPWNEAGGFFTRMVKRGDTGNRPTHQACRYANIADKRAATKFSWTAIHDCDDGYVFTVPGGYFHSNAFRLSDMIGNVAEWTQDCWNASYTGAPTNGKPWNSGDCTKRVFRGGSWSSGPVYARSAARYANIASYSATDLGFRLAKTNP
ncbi:MAG: SUMF1/EgtB/PvdO family nonheme iron enzyme [Burkholderiales bacterium]